MKARSLCTLCTVIVAVLLGTGSARAGSLGAGAGVGPPTLLRITGFIGSAPDGEQTLGTLTLGLDHTATTLRLSAVQTLNGPLTEGPAALRQYDMYNPNLLLVGDSRLLASISAAPPHTKLTLFGYVRGPQRLVVVDVQTG